MNVKGMQENSDAFVGLTPVEYGVMRLRSVVDSVKGGFDRLRQRRREVLVGSIAALGAGGVAVIDHAIDKAIIEPLQTEATSGVEATSSVTSYKDEITTSVDVAISPAGQIIEAEIMAAAEDRQDSLPSSDSSPTVSDLLAQALPSPDQDNQTPVGHEVDDSVYEEVDAPIEIAADPEDGRPWPAPVDPELASLNMTADERAELLADYARVADVLPVYKPDGNNPIGHLEINGVQQADVFQGPDLFSVTNPFVNYADNGIVIRGGDEYRFGVASNSSQGGHRTHGAAPLNPIDQLQTGDTLTYVMDADDGRNAVKLTYVRVPGEVLGVNATDISEVQATYDLGEDAPVLNIDTGEYSLPHATLFSCGIPAEGDPARLIAPQNVLVDVEFIDPNSPAAFTPEFPEMVDLQGENVITTLAL